MYTFKYISTYWQYIIGLFLFYKLLSVLFLYLKNKRNKNEIKSEESEATPDEVAEIPDNDGEEDCEYDSDITPALPKNLQHIPLKYKNYSETDMINKSLEFYKFMNKRRTVRHFSKKSVPKEIIRNIIKTAGTSPSGAHTEPWTFISVSSSLVKSQIREIVEQEEEINYLKRMGKKWTTDLKPLRTNWIKDYLTDAPYIIIVFKQMYSFTEDNKKKIHYYNEISCNIAAGFLLAAIHNAGLVSLTSTPLNCGPALRALLNRPSNEKLLLLLPVGYPAENCLIPDLKRKPLEDILIEV